MGNSKGASMAESENATRPDQESFQALGEAIEGVKSAQDKMTADEFFAAHDQPVDGEDDLVAPLAGEKPKAVKPEKGKPAPKDESDDADPGDAAPDTKAKAKAKEAEPAASVEDEAAYEDALRALRRAKTPDGVVRNLSREEVLAWGGSLAQIQRDTDGKITELQQLRSRGTETDTEKPESGATHAPSTEATAQADLTEVHTKLSEILGLDEEGGAVLKQGLEALVKPLAARLDAFDQRTQSRDAAIARLMLRAEGSELVDRFPQLKDRQKFEKVSDRALKLAKTGEYDSLSSALEDAATLEFRDEIVQTRVTEAEKKAAAKQRGRMSPPSQRPKSSASLSVEERMDAVLAGIDAGETEIRARGGW